MSTQTWTYGLIIYFVLCFTIVSLFSAAGAFSDGSMTATASMTTSGRNVSSTDFNPSPVAGHSTNSYFKDIFSFFVWNISISDTGVLGSYFWVIRIFLVWIPLTFLLISIYYSLPFTGGH